MEFSLHNIISEIEKRENKLFTNSSISIDDAFEMTSYLQELLVLAKSHIVKHGFNDEHKEIFFFRNIKPQILGKLIFYNKVCRIETGCPVNAGTIYKKYFSSHLRNLKEEYSEHFCHSDFYRYYRSGRTDKDQQYFRLGNIDYHDGLNSFVFEIDPNFSTYYDYKVSRIIANELLYNFLLAKINLQGEGELTFQTLDDTKNITWSDPKNALIELIYALYAAGVISNGNVGIRQIALIFRVVFRMPITDMHHAFHRMKTRAGSRTTFLDKLKTSLEEYMDKDL